VFLEVVADELHQRLSHEGVSRLIATLLPNPNLGSRSLLAWLIGRNRTAMPQDSSSNFPDPYVLVHQVNLFFALTWLDNCYYWYDNLAGRQGDTRSIGQRILKEEISTSPPSLCGQVVTRLQSFLEIVAR
jgi:hypothetical protein